MSDFSVQILAIKNIYDHPNADRLSIGEVLGYTIVLGKNADGSQSLKKNDLVVYIPEAAIVPDWILKKYGFWNEEKNKGMLHNGNIVKAKSLRGVISQGIVLPVINNHIENETDTLKVKLYDDVTNFLNIKKYEPVLPQSMMGDMCNITTNHTLKFDFNDIKKEPDLFNENDQVIATEKIHGCTDSETIIETLEYGSIKIKNLQGKEGCHVKSFDIIENEIVYELLEGVSILPNIDNWYEIECDNGTILKLTGNHRIWLPELKCYRKVEDLNGDEILFSD